jgi:hypothetical protein
MPDLGAIMRSAIAADEHPGKGAVATATFAPVFAFGHFRLHQFPLVGLDDGGVAVLHKILGYFSLVDLLLFGQEVHDTKIAT